jgi:hypothetical protein
MISTRGVYRLQDARHVTDTIPHGPHLDTRMGAVAELVNNFASGAMTEGGQIVER